MNIDYFKNLFQYKERVLNMCVVFWAFYIWGNSKQEESREITIWKYALLFLKICSAGENL